MDCYVRSLADKICNLERNCCSGNNPMMFTGIVQLYEGTAVVNHPNCTSSSFIFLTYISPISDPGFCSVFDIMDGQFSIQSSNSNDSSFIQWMLGTNMITSTPSVEIVSLQSPIFPPTFIETTAAVINNGNTSITTCGVVWSQSNENPTLDDHVETAVLEYGLGQYSLTWSVFNNQLTYVRAFATNANGTSYSDSQSITPNICLAKGTMIAMADGSQKPIEEIKYSDSLLVWNFDSGEFGTAHPLWIKKRESTYRFNVLSFENGTQLKTIEQHRIFNKESGSFTYPMTDDTPIGTKTFCVDGSETSLIHKEIVYEKIEFYNIITFYHMNMFANGILTSCRYNNLYPIRNMKFQKCERPVIKDVNCDPVYYHGLRLAEQTIPIQDTEQYIQRLERLKQKSIIFLDHHGVLCTKTYLSDKNEYRFDQNCVNVLNTILKKYPQLDIIISSDCNSWMTQEEVRAFYHEQGIVRQPLDFLSSSQTKLFLSDCAKKRSNEILEWVNQHEIKEYIVIDDLELNLDNFIRIHDPTKGLQNDNINQIIEIMT